MKEPFTAADLCEKAYDVAIAGAGVAGSSLALRLARAGARVALLDANRFPRDKVCGEYLSPECGELLDRLGILADLSRVGSQAITSVRITTPRGRVVEADVVGPGGSAGIGLSRLTLDAALVGRARAAGVSVVERCRIGAPILSDGKVVGLHARHPILGGFEVRAHVTIAANGRHSSLVRATGQTVTRGSRRARYIGMKRHLIVSSGGDAEPASSVGLHLIGGGYCGTCQVDRALTNVCAMMPEKLVRRYGGDLDRIVSECFMRNPSLARVLDRGAAAGEWKVVAGVRVEVSTPKLPGILYAGDCQGTVDPLGGQGMTMALLGADALVPFVHEALVSGDGVSAAIQQACQAHWHHRFDRRVQLCRLFHHALVHPGVIDAVSSGLGALAPRLLAASFRQTRDTASVGV